MYKLQDRAPKKYINNNNNRTMKRFRGGEEPQPVQGDMSSENPPPDYQPTPGVDEMGAPPQQQTMDGAPQETMDGAPQKTMDGAPQETMDGPPQETMDGPPQETMDGPPQETMDGALQETMDGPPQETMDGPPQETMDGPPQETMDGPPQETMDGAPVNEFEEPPIETSGEQGESAEIEAFRNMIGASPEAQQVYLYMNTNISTEENRDKSYKREGVLHFTDSISVGAGQTTVMSLGSVIGSRGIETTTYDKLRNVALQKIGILLGENRRCYNTKIDFERNGETILVHIYGTVYAKKSEQPTM